MFRGTNSFRGLFILHFGTQQGDTVIFLEFIPLWNIILKTYKCIPPTTTNFISPVNTCYICPSYWPSSGVLNTWYLKLKIKREYIEFVILIHFILSFKYHVFNAWGWPVIAKHVACFDILPVPSLYILALAIFVINNFSYFQTNSSVRCINTR